MRNKLSFLVFVFASLASYAQQTVRIVFTSDVHYGLSRHFRGKDSVRSSEVNAAQVEAMQSLGKIDAVMITGDLANRQEPPVQSATASWKEFMQGYGSMKVPLLLVPGNHDASNTIGSAKLLQPLHDSASFAGIYRMEMGGVFRDYAKQKINYSKDIAGIHFMFINIWPDSLNREWMKNDLAKIASNTPVFIVAHDPPAGDPKHFTNPEGEHGLSLQYENLLEEKFSSRAEQGWIDFLAAHPQIKAYFHGHENYHEFYTYHDLPVFRADSPMKGKYSAKDETLLSFELLTIDTTARTLEVTQLFWNQGKINTGEKRTVKY